MRFFFDTADVQYIEKLWNRIGTEIPSNAVLGVTTNPNAFYKVGATSLYQWELRTRELCHLITSIRGDEVGVVYVQLPYSQMTYEETRNFVKRVRGWSDGHTQIAIKLPPFKNSLDMIMELEYDEVDTNVTGIADASTALYAVTYEPMFISMIVGRMEEVGIDAKAHVSYVQSAQMSSAIIAGSMRTLEGLRWSIEYECIPTIGQRVWDLITDVNIFKSYWNICQDFSDFQKTPRVSELNIQLENKFFLQMDELGHQAYTDFSRGLL